MSELDQQLSAQFQTWERRGRGWQVFPRPVSPEPPFSPFIAHYAPAAVALDDGRKSTVLSSLVEKLNQKLTGRTPQPPIIPQAEDEPEPDVLIRDTLVELQASLPADFDITREAFEHFLSNLTLCREPIAFELLGLPNRTTIQFATGAQDAPLVRRQLSAHFPEGVFQTREGTLVGAFDACDADDVLVVEFGLGREFMLSLATGKVDPFIGLVGALSELEPGELGLFFKSSFNRCAIHLVGEHLLRSVTHSDGSPFFINAPELVDAARNKVSRQLYAAVVRIAVASRDAERSLQIACDLASSLSVLSDPQGNELIPLQNDDYPFEEHIEDVLRRQSRRSGMLLNSEELVGLVHLPGSAVRSPLLQRETGKTKPAPAIVQGNDGVLLGNNIHNEESRPVRLTPEQRVQHMHVIGVQGHRQDATSRCFNLIRQDIENGEGVGVLDPHGDLIDQILGIIPPERVNDVVLVDPSDEEYSVGFNVLHAHSELEKTLLSSDLVSVFQRLSISWGDQMGSVLKNAILAFLESNEAGRLLMLRRFSAGTGISREIPQDRFRSRYCCLSIGRRALPSFQVINQSGR